MAVTQATYYEDVLRIARGGAKPVHCRWFLEFIAQGRVIHALTDDSPVDKPDGRVMQVETFNRLRNFERNFSEEAVLNVVMGVGTFDRVLFPHRRDLEVRLYRVPLSEISENSLASAAVEVRRYRAVFHQVGSRALEADNNAYLNETAADLMSLEQYQFTLVNEVVEQLRLKLVGGIFRNCKPGQLLRTILTAKSQEIDVEAGIKPLGVSMVPPDSEEGRTHIVVPPQTRLPDLPGRIQRFHGGVYSTGCGCFYQGRHWYVYPLYAVDRFLKAKRTLTIANVPRQDMAAVESSYQLQADQLYVIATGEVKHLDYSDIEQTNEGNGVRFIRATDLHRGFGRNEGNRTKINRAQHASEFVSDPNPSGINAVPVSSNFITDNQYAEMSKLAVRQGARVQVFWENSQPDLIYPGMPCRFLYMENGQQRILYGVVLAAEDYSRIVGTVGHIKRHTQNTALTLFVTRTQHS